MRQRSLYLKGMQQHFGKVAVVVDRAPPHKARTVKKLLRENKNIKIIYLPKNSPFLNAMEGCWHRVKRVLLVSEYYRTFLEMHQVAPHTTGQRGSRWVCSSLQAENLRSTAKTYDRHYSP